MFRAVLVVDQSCVETICKTPSRLVRGQHSVFHFLGFDPGRDYEQVPHTTAQAGQFVVSLVESGIDTRPDRRGDPVRAPGYSLTLATPFYVPGSEPPLRVASAVNSP